MQRLFLSNFQKKKLSKFAVDPLHGPNPTAEDLQYIITPSQLFNEPTAMGSFTPHALCLSTEDVRHCHLHKSKSTSRCDGTLTPLRLLLLSSGSRAPLPERFQRGRLVWRRRGLVPVQRVRVVSRGPAESLHQHPHQDKTGTAGLRASRETGLTAHPAPTPSTFSHGPSMTPPTAPHPTPR